MKNQRTVYSAIIISCLIILSLSVYYLLGGFEEIEVNELPGKQRTVVGVEYFGKHKSTKLDSIRAKTIADIQSNQIKGQLTLVDYHFDSKDSVKFFIGTSIDDTNSVVGLPSGYAIREFSGSKTYQVIIDQNFLVRPMPEEVKEAVETKTRSNKDKLAPYSFELYYEDGSLIVEYFSE